MAHDYDEAIQLYQKLREYLLCVISDVRYKLGEKKMLRQELS
jgi:hypothetical protein